VRFGFVNRSWLIRWLSGFVGRLRFWLIFWFWFIFGLCVVGRFGPIFGFILRFGLVFGPWFIGWRSIGSMRLWSIIRCLRFLVANCWSFWRSVFILMFRSIIGRLGGSLWRTILVFLFRFVIA